MVRYCFALREGEAASPQEKGSREWDGEKAGKYRLHQLVKILDLHRLVGHLTCKISCSSNLKAFQHT